MPNQSFLQTQALGCIAFALSSAVFSLAVQAQPTQLPAYRNLVMEGGGVRGIAYGGALQELDKQGILRGIVRVGGTSAGAIQAALLAVGYSPDEIVDVVNRTPVQRLNDGRMMFVGGSTRLLKQYGWYRGDQLTRYLTELVARKTQRPNLTLSELHALAQQHPGQYRDLYTTGTNLTLQRSQVFSYETHPDMRVADAVRISMSIPLYYRAVLLDERGRVVQGKPAPGQALAPYDINSFPSYVGALYTMALENLNPAQPTDWPRTISISTAGVSPRVKRMPASQKQQLVDSGRKGAQAFLRMGERR